MSWVTSASVTASARAERALLEVVQVAYVAGVSTRRVEDFVETLGITSMSKSQVSRICASLDAEVEAFRGAGTGAPPDPPQRLSRATLGHARWHGRPGHPPGP